VVYLLVLGACGTLSTIGPLRGTFQTWKSQLFLFTFIGTVRHAVYGVVWRYVARYTALSAGLLGSSGLDRPTALEQRTRRSLGGELRGHERVLHIAAQTPHRGRCKHRRGSGYIRLTCCRSFMVCDSRVVSRPRRGSCASRVHSSCEKFA